MTPAYDEDVLRVVEVLGFISLTFPRLSQGTDPEYLCMAQELIGSRDCWAKPRQGEEQIIAGADYSLWLSSPAFFYMEKI